MGITASELIGRVSIQGAEKAQAQLLGLGAGSDNVAAKFAGLAVGAGALLVGSLVAIGGVAAKMAGDFETSTTTLVTSAGLSKNSIDAVRQGILKMSIDTATGTDQLTKGMFNVQSALHLGTGGLQVLKAAAEGAKAENSDLAQTTDVLTTAMVNYRLPAAMAAATMNSLIATVADGKMHMQDLTGSLRNVLPVAAAFHIHLGDVEGALATMANAGDRGTSAGTHLAMMFKMLSSPVGAAKKEMADMGLDSIKLAQTMQTSLPAALKMIQDAVSAHFTPGSVEYNRAILAILGGSKSGVAGLEIMNQGLKVLGKNTADASGALRKGGSDVENWSTIQGNFNFKLDAAKNAVGALFIGLGQQLLPVLGKLLDGIMPVISQFTAWISKSGNVSGALAQVGQILKPLIDAVKEIWKDLQPVLTQLGDWAIKNDVAGKALVVIKAAVFVLSEALKFIIPIIISVVSEIVKFIAAIVERLQPKISELVTFIKTHWDAIKAITQGVWDQMAGVIKIAWAIISGIIKIALDLVTGNWKQAWQDCKDMLVNVWEGIKQVFLGGLKIILGGLALIPGPIGDMAKNAIKIIDGLNKSVVQSTQDMKLKAIQHTIDMAKGMLSQFEAQKQGIEDKMLKTKDAALRHMLAMKLGAINHAIDMETGVVKHAQGMKDQVVGHSIIPDMVAGIGNWLGKLPGLAGQWIGKMASTVLSGLGNLATSAISAGANIVGNIASGITGNIVNALGGAMSAVGNFISQNLPHSPAKMGPLKDLEFQGSQIIGQLSKGMVGAMPQLQASLNVALSPIASPVAFTGGNLTPRYSFPTAGQTAIHIHNHPPDLVIDGTRMSRKLLPYITDALRYNT